MTTKNFANRGKCLIALLFLFDNNVTWALKFESDCRNNLFTCGILVPKQFGKQLLHVYYTGMSESACHYKASMIKADSYMYCAEGNFCGLILSKTDATHFKIEDFDNVKMCQVYGRSEEKCK